MPINDTPVITALRVIPVAGRNSMLLNLSSAHGLRFCSAGGLDFKTSHHHCLCG
ncbi:MAG TPA: hypothetical protein VMR43_03265 [Variovorax sp.]|nr:hypothetical protein [Variovorax sp.]